MNSRIELAVGFLKEGQSFNVGDIRFEMENEKKLIVIGWSQYLSLTSITKNISLNELSNIKTVFREMLEDSEVLKNFIIDKRIEFKLCFDDGGKASIDICSEKTVLLFG